MMEMRLFVAACLAVAIAGCAFSGPPESASSRAGRSSGPPAPTGSQAVYDPAKSINPTPFARLVYWRAACPADVNCERQSPPLTQEAKSFETNNYYLGFDGTSAWSLFAGRLLPSGTGALLFYGQHDGQLGTQQVLLPSDEGVPTLTAVTSGSAMFTTSNGHAGILELQTLALRFTN